MNSTLPSLTLPSLTSDERERLLADTSLRSLFAMCATIPDPRSKLGQRYDLPYLLSCLVAALRGPCDSTLAVGQWCRDQQPLARRASLGRVARLVPKRFTLSQTPGAFECRTDRMHPGGLDTQYLASQTR
jgi:hypothetical protein